MSADKPSLPKGTRDFGPEQMARRHFIFGRIREVFERYGFQPLETPAMENLSVLTGKYGDEGDQLLYKVLDSGDFLSGADDADWRGGYKRLLPRIAGKGLRYDLTVPFARYVVMNRPNLTFPFRRYQIQPVWRADRPQKGRYREFYQCDADVVGTDSLLCEAECLLMIRDVFALLGIDGYEIRINSRRILSALAHRVGMPGRETAFCTALDKLDKTGRESVYADLEREGCTPEGLAALTPLLELRGGTDEKLAAFEGMVGQTEEGLRGVGEIREILRLAGSMHLDLSRVVFDPSLARGLNYYTGAILELKATRGSLKSSLGGGGRYENLTGVFGLEGVPGVGFSFGVDRIYDLMEELALFPAHTGNAVTLLVAHLDAESFVHGLGLLASLRAGGIRAEIYPEPARLKKQLAYADRKGIPFTLMVGPQEIAENRYALRNMGTSAQQLLPAADIAPTLRAEMGAIITGA